MKTEATFDTFHTLLYTPGEIIRGGIHVKATDNLKQTMNIVVMVLIPCLTFGISNAGYQHQATFGMIEPQAGMIFCSDDF